MTGLTKRRIVKLGSTSLLTSIGVAEWGYARSQLTPAVRRRTLELPNLPYAWNGLRIAQVSDVHAGAYMPAHRMRYVADLVARLHADLIVFTGDQIDRREQDAHTFTLGFRGLHAPLGIYGVLGNHDHYIDPGLAETALRRAGIRPLVNEAVQLWRHDTPLRLVGLEDLSAEGTAGPDFSLITSDTEAYTICLCHQPGGWHEARESGADLTLAGHTHGGQIAVPSRRVNVARLHSPYVAGPYTEGDATLFVSRGIGVGAIPVRIGAPPEIDLLELRTVGRAHAATAMHSAGTVHAIAS